MDRETELKDLTAIARDYHLNGLAEDLRIESLVQAHEIGRIRDLIPDGCRVLELGYGDGVTFADLVGRTDYALVEAVPDLVLAAEKHARELGATAKFHQAFFEDFVPEDSYDVVFASHVLEHVEDPSELLVKIRSWLSIAGSVIAIVPNAESVHRRLSVALKMSQSVFELSARDHVVGHRRVYSLDKLRADFAVSGFDVTHERGSFLKPLPNVDLLGLSDQAILRLCEAADLFPTEMMANLIVRAEPRA